MEEEKINNNFSRFQTVGDIRFSRSLINNIRIEEEILN